VGRLLGKTGISSLRGHWHEFHGVRVMPTFHPAYLLRSPAKKKDAWEDLKKVMHVLGKDPRKTA
jgi:DNA polymerase